MSEPCKFEKDIGGLLEAKENFEEFMREIKDNHLVGIYNRLNTITEKMNNRRPTYTTMWIISTLTTLCGILITIILRQ